MLAPSPSRAGIGVDACIVSRFGVLYAVLYMVKATRTQVYLTSDQRERIDELIKREGKSLAWVVREALDQYLAGPTSDRGRVLDATFGTIPDLEVPPRSEWDRFPGPKRDARVPTTKRVR